jgi:uroporphyrinogen-III synthase
VSRLVLTIRPEPRCSATAEAGRALGVAVECRPLFEIRPLPWSASAPDSFDALLLGSANAIRPGSLDAFRAKPVYAVGETTAAAAEAAGFTVAAIGRGELQGLVDTLSGPLRLLRVTGAEHVPLALPAGIEVATRIAYESIPLPLPAPVAAELRDGALVLLHSAAAARHFASECDRLGVPRSAVTLVALGRRIAAAAGEGWREVRSAVEPREAALLALARDMCHEPGGGEKAS